jgi:aspartyl-tRNA(Asn)/glutamyl-tRNA(Gln) amidotransferase subunit A
MSPKMSSTRQAKPRPGKAMAVAATRKRDLTVALEPHDWTMLQALDALRSKRISALELTDHCLKRLEVVGQRFNGVLEIEAARARAAARAADGVRAKAGKADKGLPTLLGLPLAHKDMFERKGKIMSCGARQIMPKAKADATVLARLADAGALYLARLHLSEFAYNPTGHNAHDGPALNPWDPARITGGSSSGSGVAVASRCVFAALGSDTGGSIRLPAHFCGITGLKPGWGRVSRAGAMPLSFSHDTIGPLARTAEDAALILQMIAGYDPRDATTGRAALPDYLAACRAGAKGMVVGSALEALLALLKRLGVRTCKIDLPDTAAINAASQIVLSVEGATAHANMMRETPELYGPQVRARLENGFAYSAVQYLEAMRYRGVALERFLNATQAVDAVLAPVAASPAPGIAETDVGASPKAESVIQRITRTMRPINFLGLPSLALPIGFSAQGLPIGAQLFGRPYSEDRLLRLGGDIQRASDWHLRSPVAN